MSQKSCCVEYETNLTSSVLTCEGEAVETSSSPLSTISGIILYI